MPVTNYPAIIGKIIRRFGLTVGLVERPSSLQPLTPVTDADQLALEPESASVATVVDGDGNTTLYTVPSGERWKVQCIKGSGAAAGTYNWQLTVIRPETVGAALTRDFNIFDTPIAADGTTNNFWYTPSLVLFPGDVILLQVSGHAVNSTQVTQIMRLREECSS